MKLLTPKLLISSVSLVVVMYSFGQTYVSGYISADTHWTAANSPYIVTDTVIVTDTLQVSANVTLTIDPGVTVKFNDNAMLLIINANLITQGLRSDSITFTSNSLSPHKGSWGGIYFSYYDFTPNPLTGYFSFCNFMYSEDGIQIGTTCTLTSCSFYNNSNCGTGITFVDSCSFVNNGQAPWYDLKTMYNSVISGNQNGIGNNQGDFIANCSIVNCIIKNNSGIGVNAQLNDSIINCVIDSNWIGLLGVSYPPFMTVIAGNTFTGDSFGLVIAGSYSANIFCNAFCNNVNYDAYFSDPYDGNIINNYWCSTDSISIASSIYGEVSFIPFDTTPCVLSIATDVSKVTPSQSDYKVFPNPVNNQVFVETGNSNPDAEIVLYDLQGQLINRFLFDKPRIQIDMSALQDGLYLLEISTKNDVVEKR